MSDDLGRWRRIYSNEWHAGAFQSLSDPERLTYFYCETGPQSTSVGIYRISAAVAVEDIGNLTSVEFLRHLDVVVQACGWRYDATTRVLWIPDWIERNPPQSPNVAKSYRKLLGNLPECDLRAEAAHAIGRYLKDFPQAFIEAFGKDFAKAFPPPKAKPESLPKANQGAGDQGIQGSERKGTGAPRASSALNALNGETLEIARRTVTRYDHTMPIDELLDHFTFEAGKKEIKRSDAISALNIALSELHTEARL